MDFLMRQPDVPPRDANEVQKFAIAEKLSDLIEKNRKGQKEEKLLKEQVNTLFSVGERCGKIVRKVQEKFKPNSALEQYLKETGLWDFVTIKEPKIVKDRLLSHVETDEKLKKLYEECLVEQNRIELVK